MGCLGCLGTTFSVDVVVDDVDVVVDDVDVVIDVVVDWSTGPLVVDL